jgi:RloB-like protein
MGTDNLFHKKRKVKLSSDLKRRPASRTPIEKVLIVFEGTKTEPNYFRELRDYYELNTLILSSDCGTDPVSVVEHGKVLYKNAKKIVSESYDRVYFVFDRDSYHLPSQGEKYQKALEKISMLLPKDTFFATQSVPCFEYWLLLHFKYTTTPFSGSGGKSVGEAVLSQLINEWRNYNKGIKNSFSYLLERLEDAKANACRALIAANNCEDENPSTHVHELVEYLQNLKK